MAILGQTFKERWHSAFLAWLLDPSGTHGLDVFPLLRLLIWIATEDDSQAARLPPLSDLESWNLEVLRIQPNAKTAQENKEFAVPYTDSEVRGIVRFDVFVAYRLTPPRGNDAEEEPRLGLLVVEMKVHASQGKDQTIDYAKWALDEKYLEARQDVFEGEAMAGIHSALLFLGPETQQAESSAFTSMGFQEYADNLLDLAMTHPRATTQGVGLIHDYLLNLATPYTHATDHRLAIAPWELSLVADLLREHREALDIVARSLSEPYSLDRKVCQYAEGVYLGHSQALSIIEHVSPRIDANPVRFRRKKSRGTTEGGRGGGVDYTALFRALAGPGKTHAVLYFKHDKSLTVSVEVQKWKTGFSLGGVGGLSGAEATRRAAKATGTDQPSDKYRWSDWWTDSNGVVIKKSLARFRSR